MLVPPRRHPRPRAAASVIFVRLAQKHPYPALLLLGLLVVLWVRPRGAAKSHPTSTTDSSDDHDECFDRHAVLEAVAQRVVRRSDHDDLSARLLRAGNRPSSCRYRRVLERQAGHPGRRARGDQAPERAAGEDEGSDGAHDACPTATTPDQNPPKKKHGFAGLLADITPGNPQSFPLPLLVLGALAILLVVAGGAGMVWQRSHPGDGRTTPRRPRRTPARRRRAPGRR